ncbi:MAG: MoxR family ATPase [Magnetococcales bacterium]|nr:MoxR family ATPase [Magnetococcales bacterium]MBF0261744.1 MoxR family ATPase [Magnetococcales bacterium]
MSTQPLLKGLEEAISRKILGQEMLVNRMLIALLADGHLLVEGAPGLAKTRAIKCLAEQLEGAFQRIQFTPDLLPADLTGTEIFRPQEGSFQFQPGPLFHNLILADEINRAPAKVQSALLEAMGERQITVGAKSHPLPALFLVMATQNPIEHEGTHPLPEAQLDRFLMLVRLGYPTPETERDILRLVRAEALEARPDPASAVPLTKRVAAETILAARREVLGMHMAEAVERYLVQLVLATRHPERYDPALTGWVHYGASPRATIALDRCARAHAWLAGRAFVIPEDVRALASEILRHRIGLTFEAEARGATPDRLITLLLERVPVP